jgi:hypothetical protein
MSKHVPFDDFAGGLDLRSRIFAKRVSFRKLRNFYVNNGKKLVRRPPLLSAGFFDAKCQGAIKLNGKIYAIAKKGDSITHTGAAAALVTTLYFDNPDYCTTWQLVRARVFNGQVQALIRHTFPGLTVTSRLFWHAFDGKALKPTYVEDAHCPTSWTPSLPLHDFGQGTAGSFFDYTPGVGAGASRAWIARPDGEMQLSKLSNTRRWNTRSLDNVLRVGEEWYFILPNTGAGIRTFVVSSPFSELAEDRKWSAYVLEYLDATGTWQKFLEDATTPTVDKHYWPTNVASRFGGADEIQLKVYWAGASDTIVRFRLIAGKPPVSIVSGCEISGSSSTSVIADGTNYQFQTAVDYTEFIAFWQVYLDTVLQTPSSPQIYTVQNISGKARVVFAYDSFGTPGTTQWQTNIDYGTFTGSPGCKVFMNGTLLSASVYTVSNVGGKAKLTGNSFTFVGLIEAIYLPGASSAVKFSRNTPVISAGVINFEGGNYNTPAVDLSGLAVNRSYQVNVVVPGISGVPATLDIGPAGTQQVVPGNGYKRYYAFTGFIISLGAVAPVTITSQAPYLYGADDVNPSIWFNSKKTAYVLDDVGAPDPANPEAGPLRTSTEVNSGGTVLAVSRLLSRMAFHYAGSTVAYQVNEDASLIEFVDASPFGVGAQASPQEVPYFDGSLIITPTGPRLFSLVGNNSQSMQDTNLGLPIENLGVPAQRAACFWPHLGLFVSAGVLDGLLFFTVLSYSRESQITAWATWDCGGLTDVDSFSLIDIDSRLYLRSGTALYYFDALPAAYKDSNDGATAYESRAELNFHAFGDADSDKKISGVGFVQNGTATLLMAPLPHNPSRVLRLCTATGTTYGKVKIPLTVRGKGIAAIISTTDAGVYDDPNGETQGYVLEQLGFDVAVMGS